MTLFKAINAARYFLEYSRGCDISDTKQCVNDALAALPDKPKSEDELVALIINSTGLLHVSGYSIRQVLKALKAANVLYVSEGK